MERSLLRKENSMSARQMVMKCLICRFDGSGEGRSSCQLTSVPSEHLDASHDFNADRDYDFFERDRNAPKSCSRPLAGLRPWTQYGSQRFHGVMGGYGGYGVGGYSMRHPPSDGQYLCPTRNKSRFISSLE